VSLHVLVLAGGSGTRLWPLSRRATPKHLLPLAPGGATLLRATVERVLDVGESVHVVTAAAQAEQCLEALAGLGLGREAVIAEPDARGTGPALGLATRWVSRSDPAAIIASVHADHRVGAVDAYRAALVASAGWAAASGGLATVGLTPTDAATGLGYIELGARLESAAWTNSAGRAPAALVAEAAGLPAFTALGFAEKPSAARAAEFVAGGRHLWNLGLFAWPAAVFLDELRSADPQLSDAIDDVVEARARGDEARAGAVYRAQTAVPVEPLVLERSRRLTVVQASFSWSDLGSWADLHAARVEDGDADAAGNVVDGDVLLLSTRDTTVEARGGRLVAVAGVDGLVVVDTPDALLVVPAAQSQLLKDLVQRLGAQGREEVL
jgi:mannose-1-phosphate guanylyltransferase